MKKRLTALLLCGIMGAALLTGCNSKSGDDAQNADDNQTPQTEGEVSVAPPETESETISDAADDGDTQGAEQFEATQVQFFAAASLQSVMTELISMYNETQPNVEIVGSYDSSGTLLSQIEEGFACDVFFSAAQTQMNTLEEEDGLVVEGTRANVVNNQVCIVALKDSETAVTGLDNISEASSFALADGSVPVGKYTRTALIANGQLDEVEDPATITTQQVSEALGVEISEQGNVSKVLMAVAEGSCEVGTVYYSDYIGYENKDELEVIEMIPYDLTGNVIYPVAQVVNSEADDLEAEAAADFVAFILSDEAKAVFEEYGFDVNVE